MIEREGCHFTLICDHCEHEVEAFDGFEEVVMFKKKRGWKSVKGKSGWFEFCPNCSTPEIMNEYRGK